MKATITGNPDKGVMSAYIRLKKGVVAGTTELRRVFVFAEMNKNDQILSLELVLAPSRQKAVDASQIFGSAP